MQQSSLRGVDVSHMYFPVCFTRRKENREVCTQASIRPPGGTVLGDNGRSPKCHI